MADNANDEGNQNKIKFVANCSTLLTSNEVVSPNLETQYDLRWPASQDRDLTQIITEDLNANFEGDRCPDKMQEKKYYCPEQNKTSLKNDNSKTGCFHWKKSKKKQRKLSLQSELGDSRGLHKTSYWDVLSDEIILGVFSFLAQKDLCVCAQVCKRWHILAYDESLWQSLDLTGLTMNEHVFQRLLIRGVVVMRLAWLQVVDNLSSAKCESFDESTPECNADDPCSVQYLDASSCTMKENMLLQSLLKCRNLKKLSLESCSVSTGVLRAISRCNELSVLNLCMCTQITKRGLRSLASGCKRITELNLGWTNLTPESVATVVKNFPLLVKLNLSGCRKTLRDEALSDLLDTCRNLTCLDVSDCIELSEKSIKSFVEHGKMMHLGLSRCYGITPKSLESLSSLKSLRTLQIFGVLTDPGINRLKKILESIAINGEIFSTIARPTGSVYTQTIWGMKCLGPR